MALTAEQQENVRIIVRVGESMDLDPQTIAAAIATAMMESNLVNNPGGDRDSVGLFQQRPSQGWGSIEQISDPEYAAKRFFQAYTRSTGATVLERIANTQRPAAEHRAKYANFFGAAQQAYTALTKIEVDLGGPGSSTAAVAESPAPTEPGARIMAGNLVINDDGTVSVEQKDEIKPDSPPAVIEAYIREHYPEVAPFLADEQIKWILYDAAINEKDATEIISAIRQTDYWNSHGPTSRAFDALLAEDKVGAEEKINETRILVDQEYQKQGIHKSRAELDKTTLAYIRGGWDINDLTRSIANEMGRSLEDGHGLDAGDSAADADTFITWAKDMGLPLDRTTAEKWALEVAGGKQTSQGVKSRLMGLARGRWQYDPEVLEYINGGGTAADYFAIHRNIIGETLELSPDSIDLFNDPRYADITQKYDVEAKAKRSMTTGEVAQWARNQDEYARTDKYRQQDAQFTDALLRTFGEVA